MESYNVLGLMSGTSLDGLDIANVRFDHKEGKWTYWMQCANTVKFPPELLVKIKKYQGCADLSKLSELDNELAQFFADSIKNFIKDNSAKVDMISSHGQTIYHSPENKTSIQLGSGRIMSEMIDLPIICDFRSQDVEMGGQGAPLVPIGDLYLFSEYKYCLNLGGISNISVKEDGHIIASDLSICNTALNHFARKMGLDYDYDGKIASSGNLSENLLRELNALQYHSRPWPKTLDSSFFYEVMLPLIESENELSINDTLCTLTHYIAVQVQNSVAEKTDILATGGGCHNTFLMKIMMEEYGLQVQKEDNTITDFKEALIFAFIGLLRYKGEINVLSSVTGALKDHCSGRIYRNGKDYHIDD